MRTIKEVFKDWDILVVDDEDDCLDVVKRLLKRAGAKVTTAVNGMDALNVLDHLKPKFILADLSMPSMDGWKLLDAIKHNLHMSELPVIALTAHAMIGDRERGIAAGFYDYITKPFDPARFVDDLVRLLGGDGVN